MPKERVFTAPLLAFLAVVLSLLGYAGWSWLLPNSLPDLVRALQDADLERGERCALLRRICELDPASDPALPLCREMAAVALDDEGALVAAGGGGEELLLRAADVAHVDTAALGDEVLASLLAAMAAELVGDTAVARTRYRQVAASSRLFHMHLVGRLCARGLARLP